MKQNISQAFAAFLHEVLFTQSNITTAYYGFIFHKHTDKWGKILLRFHSVVNKNIKTFIV